MRQARIEINPDADRRSDPRRAVGSPGTLRDGQDRPLDVLIDDVSQGGCAIHSMVELEIGQSIRLGVAGARPVDAVIVRRDGDRYGCQFRAPLTAAEVRLAGEPETVIVGPFPARVGGAVPPPRPTLHIAKLSGAVRLALIVGLSLTLWTGLYVVVAQSVLHMHT